MTTAHKLTYLPTLTHWLADTVTRSDDKKYHHRRLEEDLAFRADIIKELQILMHDVHEDARMRYRNAFDITQSLDPLEEEVTPGIDTSIIDDFPRYLELTTLKGYFGEVMAAIIAENLNPLDEEWHVPAFPFRFHQSAYHAMEHVRQEGGQAPTIIGRFGDDMLAFQRNSQGHITRALLCEAKCSASHKPDLIAEAHIKARDKKLTPVDCFQLAELLKERAATDPEAAKWWQAIKTLWLSPHPSYERCDLVNYVFGLPPVRATTIVIPTTTPHTNYTAGRRLEAVEIHLYDIDGLVEEAYKAIIQPIFCALTPEDLSHLWRKVVSCISTTKQSLFQKNCSLLAFNEQIAVVGVCSLSVFRNIQHNKKYLQAAFIKSGQVVVDQSTKGIKIKLKVANFA